MPEREFPETRRRKGGGGGDTGITRRDPRNPPTTRPHWGAGRVSEEPESEQHELEGAGGPEGAFELERVEHEPGGIFGPEGATSEELELEKNVSARAGRE